MASKTTKPAGGSGSVKRYDRFGDTAVIDLGVQIFQTTDNLMDDYLVFLKEEQNVIGTKSMIVRESLKDLFDNESEFFSWREKRAKEAKKNLSKLEDKDIDDELDKNLNANKTNGAGAAATTNK